MGSAENRRSPIEENMKQESRPVHRCLVCGKTYPLCRTCNELQSHGTLAWRANCDTAACFQVFCVLNDFDYGHVSVDEAREMLGRVLSPEMKPFTIGARRTLEKILGKDSEWIQSEEEEKPCI